MSNPRIVFAPRGVWPRLVTTAGRWPRLTVSVAAVTVAVQSGPGPHERAELTREFRPVEFHDARAHRNSVEVANAIGAVLNALRAGASPAAIADAVKAVAR